ncbi:MAG: hypothetical protein IT250_17405 [Chitinophagaceae bacterium]|nr:hypothetical protein [Chitinophagaceae bacterium]
MKEKPQKDRKLLLFEKAKFENIRNISESILNSTIQLFFDDKKGHPRATGSGVLFELANKHFVFTAAHVIAENPDDTYAIIGHNAAYLGGMLHSVTLPMSRNRNDDKIDLAIIELDPIVAERLTAEYKFQTVNDILLNHTANESTQYLSIGYPVTKTKKIWGSNIIRTIPFIYNSKAQLNFKYQNFGFDTKTHIAIGFNREVISDSNSNIHLAPDLKGISGSGIWYLPNFPAVFHPQQKKLIAISIEQINNTPNQAIIATKIDSIIDFIVNNLEIKLDIV